MEATATISNTPSPRVVAWEMTRQCALACRHCRASASMQADPAELTTEEGLRLIESLASLSVRLLILTGGEPMMRSDLYPLAQAASAHGIRVVMAPCGPLLNEESSLLVHAAGIAAVSLSLDFPEATGHDAFRGVEGAFDTALAGIRCARQAGLSVQINTTVSRLNVDRLPEIVELAKREGASTVDFFFLVPTGRGSALKDIQLDAGRMEQVLNWIAELDGTDGVRLKSTCAPQMARIHQQRGDEQTAHSDGCMAGRGFLFISHVGEVQPCGFLNMKCGNVRDFNFDVGVLLDAAEELRRLGDRRSLGGACGQCGYAPICGGCRARAEAMSGDAHDEEPFCVWGKQMTVNSEGAVPEDAIITALQRGIPLVSRPFDDLAAELGTDANAVLTVLRRMLAAGSARRFGAVFDARRLGYRSELCALVVPEEEMDQVGAVIAAHAGVTHCYRRGQPHGIPTPVYPEEVRAIPALWFTLAVLSETFEEELAQLQASVAPFALWRLPALRRFKIDVIFDPARREAAEQVPGNTNAQAARRSPQGIENLSGNDRRIVRAMEDSLPVEEAFYAGIAVRLGMTETELLTRLRDWHASGTLRRVGMIVRHHQIGFIANAMCVWPVDAGRLLDAGRRLAQWPEVTHCYERPALPGWPYQLYSMIHTGDWQNTRQLFDRISRDAGLEGGLLMGSLHEYKKTSMHYFAIP